MIRNIRLASLVALAITALVLPATASAKPNRQDAKNASQQCRAERGTTEATREAFAARYRNFGACVSQRTREEHSERHEAKSNASRQCREERGTTEASREAFRQKYGTNANKSNAFGKCVSQKARANKKAEDQEDEEETEDRQNAAEQCDAERGETAATREAFRQKYGTNRNKSNAFGKCVSQKAQAQQDDEQQPPTA